MKEKLLIVFVALVVGLTIATVGFYLFKTTKHLPQEINNKLASIKSTEKKAIEIPSSLSIIEPKEESITDKRTIQIKGKTTPNNTIVISTDIDDYVQSANSNGEFSLTIAIDTGTNKVTVRSISPDGEETTKDIIVTFSQEDF